MLTPAEMGEQVQEILNKQALSNSDVLATSFDLAVTEEELYKYNQPGSPYLNPEVRKGYKERLRRSSENATMQEIISLFYEVRCLVQLLVNNGMSLQK